MRFALLGEATPTNFVKLTILDKGTALVAGKMPGPRLTEGRPYYQEAVSNELPVDPVSGEVGEPQWYPVEWDLTEYTGRMAVLAIAHFDKEKMMAVDDFEFFDDASGCLPSCMSIRDGVCNGGDETCFYFEEDLVPTCRSSRLATPRVPTAVPRMARARSSAPASSPWATTTPTGPTMTRLSCRSSLSVSRW
jgi:hypothetical protein